MLGLKLVRLIEKHSDEIAEELLTRLQESERTPAYRDIREEEIRAALVSLYAHLEEWLLTKAESDVEHYFRSLGARRAGEEIPPSQLAWALLMYKAQLWRFIRRESIADNALELYAERELMEAIERFFDRAVYYALIGYEGRARKAKVA